MNKKLIICLIAIVGIVCLSPVMASESNIDISSLTQSAGFLDGLFPASVDIEDMCIVKEKFTHTHSDGKVDKSTRYYLKFNLKEPSDKQLDVKVISYDKKGKKLAVNNESISGSAGEYTVKINPGKNITNATLLIYDGDSLIFNQSTTKIEKTSDEQVDTPKVEQSTSSSSSSSSGQTYWASSNSGKFHYPSCEWGQKISGKNKVVFHSRDEAISSGYSPCQVCGP